MEVANGWPVRLLNYALLALLQQMFVVQAT